MAKRTNVGDVLAVELPEGLIYLHFVGTHREYGDGVAVCPTVLPGPVAVAKDLFRDSYFTFYPARAATNRGFAKVVGWLASPGIPARLRRAGVRVGTQIKTWIIEDGSNEELRHELSDAERQLPIAAIWNHEYLVQSVREGRRPEDGGRVHDVQ